ncbi:MAG: FxLYD domain-containing protein [Phycisphaerales bacterium]
MRSFVAIVVTLLLLVGVLTVKVSGQQPPTPPGNTSPTTSPQADATTEQEPEADPLQLLLDEIQQLHTEILTLRRQVAQAQMASSQAQRELAELRQFIDDRHEFGQDFQQYQAVKAIAEREARERRQEVVRDQREAQQAERQTRRQAARAERAQREAQARRLADYRRAGFTPLGLDVYVGKMAYYYRSRNTTFYDIEYDPFLSGYFVDPEYRRARPDFSSMTISGSVLNASDEVRNFGVAITFFDENGNQVGSETIQINNARPNVPYPFTSTLTMALNRPFSSSTTYVLYADSAEGEPPPAPSTPSTSGSPRKY